MAEFDPRSLSFTEEEKKIGSSYNPYVTSQPAPRKPAPTSNLGQQFVVVEKDDTWESIAAGLQLDTADLLKANPDEMSTPNIGTAVNIPDTTPQFGGLTEEEQFRQDRFGVGGAYIDFLTHQETLDVTGVNKFGGRTSQPFETDFGTMQIPEGFNFEEFRMFAENTKGTGFWEEYRGDLGVEDVLNLPPGMGEAVDPRFQSYTAQELAQQTGQFYPESIIETGGIPTFPQWEQNPVTGEWNQKPAEAIFDELYRTNGVDPNNKYDVELFWSVASDDMLYAAEFFDVIEWPSGGGYGGYGGMPTPSRQYGRGQQPSRGDYASYVSLTSWSI